MECSWNITGPADSRLVLVFYRICLGICTSVVAQRCGCDSLRVSNVYKSRQLCLETELIPFISLENRISFTMVTDEQYPSKGFIADYESVSLQGGELLLHCVLLLLFSAQTPRLNWDARHRCATPRGFHGASTFLYKKNHVLSSTAHWASWINISTDYSAFFS